MEEKMPVIFAGHGSPLNAIEDNEYSRGWQAMAQQTPRPRAILSISAHWYTEGTLVCGSEKPKVVNDMYGFPKELYEVNYIAPGDPQLAGRVAELLGGAVRKDDSWGIDHGSWAVLCKMWPVHDIPVVQLSVNRNMSAREHFDLGIKLRSLRREGVLIMGSGDVVHNLRLVDWEMAKGCDWAEQFDHYIRDKILARNYDDVINYASAGEAAKKSVPTPEHYYPLLCVLGASEEEDKISVFNDSCTLGAISMTSYMFK